MKILLINKNNNNNNNNNLDSKRKRLLPENYRPKSLDTPSKLSLLQL